MNTSIVFKTRRSSFFILFLIVLVASGIMCKKSPTSPGGGDDTTQSLYERYQQFAGTWQGQWQNNTFSTSGPASATADVQADGTVSATIDLGGSVFGLLDPPPQTVTSTYNNDGVVFEETGTLIGDIKVTLTRTGENTGSISIQVTNIPISGINSLTASGTINLNSLHLDYTINFSDGSSANGVLDLTHGT